MTGTQHGEPMKKWAAGIADEPWKIMLCARDAAMASETIGRLIYILTDAASDRDKGVEILRGLTGKEIIDGLIAYQGSAAKSVQSALPNAKGTSP